jgi:uncharacterized membrane protein
VLLLLMLVAMLMLLFSLLVQSQSVVDVDRLLVGDVVDITRTLADGAVLPILSRQNNRNKRDAIRINQRHSKNKKSNRFVLCFLHCHLEIIIEGVGNRPGSQSRPAATGGASGATLGRRRRRE